MNKICTSIEQSKKLIELGLDVNTADMYYQWYSEKESALHVGKGSKKLNADCPAWSLSALYALLPEKTDISKAYSNDCVTMVYWCWTVMSEDENECDMIIETSDYDNPVDACYEMIIKLHERNLL